MNISISDDSISFIAETAYEVVHILAAAQVCKVPFEGNAAIVDREDMGTLRKVCETLWPPALAQQHFRSIVKETKRRKKRIGYGNVN